MTGAAKRRRRSIPDSRGRTAARSRLAPAPATVAAERKRLQRAGELEVRRRTREYGAAMRALEAAPPGRRGAALRAGRAAARTRALRILAEGDSWFDYPPFEVFGSGGIIPRLEKRIGIPILNLATAGDEVRFMLGVKERKVLMRQLADGSPAGGKWDALFFSGGGNDVVDNPMALWVRDFDPALPPEQHVDSRRFDIALGLVRAGYEDLIALRDALSPATHLFFHTYDFAIPDGRGVCHLGPWLKPTFDLRRFPANGAAAFAVVREMLRRFAAMLKVLAAWAPNGGVTVIDGQGTLTPVKGSWHNELHPSREGFDRFAALFQKALKKQFPTRVP